MARDCSGADIRVCVMCVGNILLLDEGVGPEVARRLLERYEFPEYVDIKDCATLGLSLVGEFRDHDLVICVDAVDKTGMPAGTVFRFTPDDIAPRVSSPTAHDIGFWDVVAAARMLGYEAEGECIGVQVGCMDPAQFEIGLTEDVERAVPMLMDSVISILVSRGVRGIIDRTTGREVIAHDE